ncbi:MAG: response regulator [Thermoguttaceae bacterium]
MTGTFNSHNQWLGASILLVDSHLINLKIASGLFGSFGISIEVASTSEEALSKLQEDEYDMVFVDLMMPEVNGTPLPRLIRQLGGKAEQLPIIALSSGDVNELRDSDAASRVNDFMCKPLKKSELNYMLVRWLPEKEDTASVKVLQTFDEINRLLPEINVELGLMRTGENQDIYLKTLVMFHRMMPEKTERVKQYLQESKIREFIVDIHGLKGSLAGMGCEGLSKKAADIESAAKVGEIGFCEEHTAEFLERMQDFHDRLKTVVTRFEADQRTTPKKPGTPEVLWEHLAIIQNAIELYNMDTAVEMLEKLMEFSFAGETDQCLNKIKGYLEDYDYNNAKLLITSLLSTSPGNR